MKKIIPITALVLCLILVLLLGLGFSDQFNNFVFAKIINPYDPLQVKNTESMKSVINIQDYWKDPRGLFPIFAFNVPDSSKDLTASLKIMEEGGINIVINNNMSWLADAHIVKQAFNKLGNSNLRWLTVIANKCKDDFIYNNSDDETNSNIKKYLSDFNDEYVYGWYIWDEPGNNRKLCSPFNLVPNDDNADVNRMVIQIRSDSVFNKKLDYTNLFPTYWDSTPNAAAYEKYIDAFIASQEFKPRVLCFDNYPLLKSESGGFRRNYYSNLDIIRKKSIKYNIPFWMIVLSSEHLSYHRPSFEEISLQVYSALAYGVKGIGYYLYSKSWEKLGYKSWILEDSVDNDNVADSLHGTLFLPVKKLNNEIQILGKTLLNLECFEVIHSSDYPNAQEEMSESLLKVDEPNQLIKNINNIDKPGSDPKVLIGVLREKNSSEKGTYLLAVNKDVTKNANVAISLSNIFKIFRFDKNDGEKIFIKEADIVNGDILPGSGELFYVE